MIFSHLFGVFSAKDVVKTQQRCFHWPIHSKTLAFDLLLTACKVGHLTAIKDLAEKGFSLDDDNRGNLLIVACKQMKVDVALFLIDCGVNINRTHDEGNTPIQIACAKGLLPVVQSLAGRQISLDRKAKDGNRLLHIALKNKQVAMVDLLIDAGMNIAERDTGRQPYQWLVRQAFAAQWSVS
eukprot:m.301053 g.301053  ORF g.301053 m.301053 type:complete len:182 (+) comp40805_c1_seq12:1189-1734(+)